MNDLLQFEQWCKDNAVTEVEALVPDMTGQARGKVVPPHQCYGKEGLRLPEAVFLQTITGDYPEDEQIYSIVSPADIDLYLKPDKNTATIVPWSKESIAQVIHDCYLKDNTPHPLAPRNVLKKVLKLYSDIGLKPIIAPELEFYFIQKNLDPKEEIKPASGRSGRPETSRKSFSIGGLNEFDHLITDMYEFCDKMKLDVESVVHESGAAQIEVNFEYSDPLSRADQIFYYKRLMHEVAYKNDIYVTFLAKPMEQEPGSSMHLHQSLHDAETGDNVFGESSLKGMSQLFKQFIAGQQKYAPAAMLFYAPNINSYRRIFDGDGAPNNTYWGFDNRTAGLRIPHSSAKSTRVEVRFSGSDANPYLAMAASLASGYLGIKNKLQLDDPVAGDAYELKSNLPTTMEDAIKRIENCSDLHDILGDSFVKMYIAIKRKEYENYFSVISSWERRNLLLNV